ncbi:MAG TPA: TIGR01777 family oxidoreductase [Pyrinomonadaceae bacterium]|jgi:uncharacterized protein (TIGR01777 family)|nr:TIGR01777 family oxidoreductase [Pyrinomonadaceae bacterium]
MKIIVTGATGLVGSALIPALLAGGHQVTRLVRSETRPAARGGITDVQWNPADATIDAGALEGHDAAVHLAGENIAERWTEEKKRRLLESREKGTRLLSETLARLEHRPRVLVCASAVGFYGAERGDELLTEASTAGKDFLAEICLKWEAAADAARASGMRVVHLRIGIVLSGEGGALGKMLTPFKMGVGGRIGSGKQWMSWVAIDDVVGIIKHALRDEQMSGAVNTVAPAPVTNSEFTSTLGDVLGRPTIFPVPAFAVRLMFGEMGEALLLSGTRVEPARLRAAGYNFAYTNLADALRHVLKK